MRQFFTNLRDIAKTGFLFLLPVYVLFIIITVGTRLAAVFGMKSILGVGAPRPPSPGSC